MPKKGTSINKEMGDVFMFNLKHLKVLISKAMLRALLAAVLILSMLVLTIPADLGALFVSAAANEWDGKQLEQFENYSGSYYNFANGRNAYQIANAKQLAFLAAVLNATPTQKYSGCYTVQLDIDGDNTTTNTTTYTFPGTSAGILVGAKFELTADIDLNDKQWTPIGNATNKFCGTFDGKGHIVSGLSYVDEDTLNGYSTGIGLFGQTGSTTIIKDLHVKGTVKTNQANMGGIVGFSAGALQMQNCSFSGIVQGGGYNYSANVGGLIGNASTNQAVTITDCFVYGEGTAITGVTASGDNDYRYYNPESIGGLVGYVGAGCDMTISDSYAESTVTGWNGSGGLIGTIGSDINVTTVSVVRCYTAGSIVSAGCAGGLVGWVRDYDGTNQLVLTIEDSYSVADLTNATGDRASGLISSSREDPVVKAAEVQISLSRCHFAGINAKQPIMYYDNAYSTLGTVEHVYYRAGSTTAKTHTLQEYSEEKNRKEFLDGRVAALLGDAWTISESVDYPVLGHRETPSLSSLVVNNEEITLIDGVFEYTVSDVENTVESVPVSATPKDGATVTVDGADANNYVALGIPGTTTPITVTVTCNSVFSTTYTINVYRKPDKWNGDTDATRFAGGDGSEMNPYQIKTGAELELLAQKVNAGATDTDEKPFAGKHYKLMNDIDLGDNKFTPIGNRTNVFRGTFDGDGHTIENLFISETTRDVGLFGSATGTIENLSVEGNVKTTNVNVAGFVGFVPGTGVLTIRNCTFSGTVEGGESTSKAEVNAAAFVGCTWICTVTIEDCTAVNTTITDNSTSSNVQFATGGFVGLVQEGTNVTIKGSSFDGGEIAGGNGVGGLVGSVKQGGSSSNNTTVTIENSYTDATISAQRIVGGLVGHLRAQSSGKKIELSIKDSYSVATVSTIAASVSGGLVGQNFAWDDYPVDITVTIADSFFAGSAQYPILNSTTAYAKNTTPMTVTLTNVYYLAGSATTTTTTVGDLTPAVTRQKTAAEFADGTVAGWLNAGRTTTAVWATSTAGYPVLSDLAATLDDTLGIVGTSIRTEGVQAIRFKFSITDAAIELKELKSVGILAAKASDKIAGEHLYAHNIAKDADNYYKYADATAYTKGGSQLGLIDDGYKFLFTAALYNITENKYGIDYIARAYAKYVDAKGQEIVVYSETIGEEYFNSIYDAVDAFFNYSSPGGVTMNDLLFLKEIYEERYKDSLTEIDVPEPEDRAGGDNPQVGGADDAAKTLRDNILSAEDVKAQDFIDNGGTVYYISPKGDDSNPGTTEDKPWKSVDAINLHNDQIKAGDAVLFERGGVYRSVTSLLADPIPEGVQRTDPQMIIYAKSGVTYGAYGDSDKPKPAIYSCHQNYAKLGVWEKIDGTNIWKVYTPRSDAGSVVFNHGEAVGIKRFGVWDGTYTNGKKNYSGFITPENVVENLTQNFEYYHDHRNGVLYLYYVDLEEGKAPYEKYTDIEICPRDGVIKIPTGTEDVHIDNLTIKYTGFYGISVAEYTTGVTVTNCELGWIGGCQWYFDTYAEGSRIGNAIEFWETTTDATTNNNWIYQVYDAGLSPQGIGSDDCSAYTNLRMCGNLVEYCSYGIEWFDRNGDEVLDYKNQSTWDDYYIEDNILRFAGYGFGRQRQDGSKGPANINGWGYTYENPLKVYIRNNIFDCSAMNTVYWYWSGDSMYEDLEISGNTFYEKAINPDEPEQVIFYGPNGGTQYTATNETQLKEAIANFDPSAKLVKWLE